MLPLVLEHVEEHDDVTDTNEVRLRDVQGLLALQKLACCG